MVWRACRAVAGLASLLGVLLKKSSNINQKTPPAYAKASAGKPSIQLTMWYVYIIKGKNSFIYVGSTNNLERRLDSHNEQEVKSTKPYIPFKLVSYFALKDKETAIKLEQYLKTGSGKAFLAKRIL